MKTSHYSVTDRGLRRSNNEDYLVADAGLGLYLLADGMGGHLGGEAASRLGLSVTHEFFAKNRGITPDGLDRLQQFPENLPSGGKKLVYSIMKANNAIISAAKKDPRLQGMGTTIVALYMEEGNVFIAHVGDSRIYLLRDGVLRQLTEDHNMYNEEMKRGVLPPEQIRESPLRKRLVRALGHMDKAMVDVRRITPKRDDLFLLCSDGLTDMTGDEAIMGILMDNFNNLEKAGFGLVEMAKKGGGVDNISLILLRMDEV